MEDDFDDDMNVSGHAPGGQEKDWVLSRRGVLGIAVAGAIGTIGSERMGVVNGILNLFSARVASVAHAQEAEAPPGTAANNRASVAPTGSPTRAFANSRDAATVSSPSHTVAAVGSPAEGMEKAARYRFVGQSGAYVLDIWIWEKGKKIEAKVIAKGRTGEENFEFVIPPNLVNQFGGTPEKNAKIASKIFLRPGRYGRHPEDLQERLEALETSIQENTESFKEIRE